MMIENNKPQSISLSLQIVNWENILMRLIGYITMLRCIYSLYCRLLWIEVIGKELDGINQWVWWCWDVVAVRVFGTVKGFQFRLS